MATVVTTPTSDSSSSVWNFLGIILLLIVVALLLFYGLPMMRSTNVGETTPQAPSVTNNEQQVIVPDQEQGSTPDQNTLPSQNVLPSQIDVPDKIDVNVNAPTQSAPFE